MVADGNPGGSGESTTPGVGRLRDGDRTTRPVTTARALIGGVVVGATVPALATGGAVVVALVPSGYGIPGSGYALPAALGVADSVLFAAALGVVAGAGRDERRLAGIAGVGLGVSGANVVLSVVAGVAPLVAPRTYPHGGPGLIGLLVDVVVISALLAVVASLAGVGVRFLTVSDEPSAAIPEG